MKLNRRDFMKSVAALLAAVPLSRLPQETLPQVVDAPLAEDEWYDWEPEDFDPLDADDVIQGEVRAEEAKRYQTLHIKTPLADFEVRTYTPGDDWLIGKAETTVYASWADMPMEDVESLHRSMNHRENVTIDLSPAPYRVTGALCDLGLEVGDGSCRVRATIHCTELVEVR